VRAYRDSPINPAKQRARTLDSIAPRRNESVIDGILETSSTAPLDAKNRLLPVRRLESWKGNSIGTFSQRSLVPTAHRARRG